MPAFQNKTEGGSLNKEKTLKAAPLELRKEGGTMERAKIVTVCYAFPPFLSENIFFFYL